jgi:hypothetical protein
MQPFDEDEGPFTFPIPDAAHFAFLKHVPALQALHYWLEGDFRMGEELALFHAVKNGLHWNVPDSELEDILIEFLDLEITPEETLRLLETIRDEGAGIAS